MTWALKRQIFYVFILITFFAVLGFLIIYPKLNKPPTCMDGKQNGIETGVDCGGNCALACTAELDKISVLWARSFKVVLGRYNAVAYLENKNSDAVVRKIKYRFRFADEDNVYIGKREGETYVPPSGKFAVFEPAIGVGNSIPVYTTFEFTEAPVWVQISEEKAKQLKVFSKNIELVDQDTTPKLSAVIKNNSLFMIPDVNVIVILYDEKGNAISSSKTYIDLLKGEEEVSVNFTWPEPIVGKVIAKEIISIFDIFSVKLK